MIYPSTQKIVHNRDQKAYLAAEQLIKDRLWRKLSDLQQMYIGDGMVLNALEAVKDVLNDY